MSDKVWDLTGLDSTRNIKKVLTDIKKILDWTRFM